MARGTSGSSTRTIIRNIMALKATEVARISSSSCEHAPGMEDDAQSGHQRADDGDHDAGEHRLDGAGDVQAENQLQLGDGRDQIALVHAARLVVDVEHAAADHHRDIHGQGDRAGQQKLHVLDVGIELDDLQRDRLGKARLDHRSWLSASTSSCISGSRLLEHELVGVVDHQADARARPARRRGGRTARE